MSDNPYETIEYAARYIDANWSDVLFPDLPACTADAFDPRLATRPTFYRRLVDITAESLGELSARPRTVCDVGAGAGRFAYEYLRRFPATDRFVLGEPSARFLDLARRFLTEPDDRTAVPMYDSAGVPVAMVPTAAPERVVQRADQVAFVEATAEGLAERGERFDLVTCLNVADRVEDPAELVRGLGKLVVEGGVLVFCSPMDWENGPAPRERWVDDQRALFADDPAWTIRHETETFYDFRTSTRRGLRFVPQVLVAVRGTERPSDAS